MAGRGEAVQQQRRLRAVASLAVEHLEAVNVGSAVGWMCHSRARLPDAGRGRDVQGGWAGRSEAEVAEAGVIVGTAAQGPMKAALGLADWRIVDAGETAAHQAVFAKLPILVPVGAEPGAAVVVPLIRKAHGDAVSRGSSTAP